MKPDHVQAEYKPQLFRDASWGLCMAGLTFFMLPRSPTHLTDCRKNKGSTMASSSAKLNLTKSKSRAEIQLLQRLDPTIPVTCSADLCENHQGMSMSAPPAPRASPKAIPHKKPQVKTSIRKQGSMGFQCARKQGRGREHTLSWSVLPHLPLMATAEPLRWCDELHKKQSTSENRRKNDEGGFLGGRWWRKSLTSLEML